MNNKTKMWVGIFLLGLGGYLLYKQYGKPTTTTTATTTPAPVAMKQGTAVTN